MPPKYKIRVPRGDARVGSGYGHIGSPTGAGTTWQYGGEYPYNHDFLEQGDDDEYLADEEGPENDPKETQKFRAQLRKKMPDAMIVRNPYEEKSGRVDRSSFVRGRGLGESDEPGTADGIVSIPRLYRGMDANVGGIAWSVNKTKPGRIGGSGSKEGFFSAPPPIELGDGVPGPDDEEIGWEIPSDDELQIRKIKREHRYLRREFRILLESMK